MKKSQPSFRRHARGNIGDGKVFVLPLEQAVRIRIEERVEAAI